MSTTAPARVGDETTLFAELHPKLARQVRRLVRTGEENVQDACSFAFLQLLRYEPCRGSVFSWLLTVAVREAVKLDQLDRRLPAREDGVELERVDERADPSCGSRRSRRSRRSRLLA
jgi:DNA-directed RNA polymerase specialized sigma24 family protein